jgi:hypothetical protein
LKFKVIRSSRCGLDDPTEIEINTLEELVVFVEKSGYHIIIKKNLKDIEIYDGYRE